MPHGSLVTFLSVLQFSWRLKFIIAQLRETGRGCFISFKVFNQGNLLRLNQSYAYVVKEFSFLTLRTLNNPFLVAIYLEVKSEYLLFTYG